MQRPNFIIFMTDHQRADTIAPMCKAKTPNTEKFFKRAVAFTEAYCPAPHCCPSRATFFSGLYPSEHGIWNNVMNSATLSTRLYDNVHLFSEDLKEAGYDLFFTGKWHVSREQSPDDFGFEILDPGNNYPWAKQAGENVPKSRDWDRFKNAKRIDTETDERGDGEIIRPGYKRYRQYGEAANPYNDGDKTRRAVEKLESLPDDARKPFCMYVGSLGPHDPYDAPQRFLDMYPLDEITLPESFSDDMSDKPALYRRTRQRYDQLTPEEHKKSVRHYLALCSYEDYLFGQLLDAVEKKGLQDSTVIIYVSDHGDYVGSHGLWAKGLPCFKEAYNVCSMIGGAGIVNPGREERSLVSLADYAPTILELAGVKTDRAFTGASLVPFLKNETPADWRTEMYTQTNGNEILGTQRAVFDKDWKFVHNTFDFDELYNLKDDPHETVNLLHGLNPVDCKYTPIVKKMQTKLWEFAYQRKDANVGDYIMTALASFGPGVADFARLDANADGR